MIRTREEAITILKEHGAYIWKRFEETGWSNRRAFAEQCIETVMNKKCTNLNGDIYPYGIFQDAKSAYDCFKYERTIECTSSKDDILRKKYQDTAYMALL